MGFVGNPNRETGLSVHFRSIGPAIVGASWRDGQLRRIISFGITPFGRDPLGETTPTKGITPFGRDPLGETTPAKGITPFGRDP